MTLAVACAAIMIIAPAIAAAVAWMILRYRLAPPPVVVIRHGQASPAALSAGMGIAAAAGTIATVVAVAVAASIMEVPLSPDLMTAQDVADDSELFGVIAQVIDHDGTSFVEDLARNLPVMERTGRFPAVGGPGPEWLTFCRHRIATLTAGAAEPAG